MTKARLERLLADLENASTRDAMTLYLKPGSFPSLLNSTDQECIQQLVQIEQVAHDIRASETGACIFWNQERIVIILPPFPVEQDSFIRNRDTTQLRSLLAREYLLGVILLRLGRFSVGVFQGDRLVASKTDSRYVKGRHHAGGWSQKRFERIREKQIQELFDKVCAEVQEKFIPFEKQLDYIYLSGEKFTLQGFLKRCDYLQRLASKISKRTLNVKEPSYEALEKISFEIWKSQVFVISQSSLQKA